MNRKSRAEFGAIEADIAQGRFGAALREAGRMASAIGFEAVAEPYWEALHRAIVSRAVIDNYLDRMGTAASGYRGFSGDPDLPDKARLLDLLQAFIESLPVDHPTRSSAEIFTQSRQAARGRVFSPEDMGSGRHEARYLAHCFYLLAQASAARSEHHQVISYLESIERNEIFRDSTSSRLFGRANLGIGEAKRACQFFDEALRQPSSPWFLTIERFAQIGHHKNFALVFNNDQFYAIPMNRGVFVRASEEAILRNIIAPRVRAWAIGALPGGIQRLLRAIIHRTPLRRLFIRPADIERLPHGSSIGEVIEKIDRTTEGLT